jgi:hypothetical protein
MSILREAGNTIVFCFEYEQKGSTLHSLNHIITNDSSGPKPGSNLLPTTTDSSMPQFLVFAGITSGEVTDIEAFVDAVLPKTQKAKVSPELSSISTTPIKIPFTKFVMLDSAQYHVQTEVLAPVQDGMPEVSCAQAEDIRYALLGLKYDDFRTYQWVKCFSWDEFESDGCGGIQLQVAPNTPAPQHALFVDQALASLNVKQPDAT